jgi:hypothetical protein
MLCNVRTVNIGKEMTSLVRSLCETALTFNINSLFTKRKLKKMLLVTQKFFQGSANNQAYTNCGHYVAIVHKIFDITPRIFFLLHYYKHHDLSKIPKAGLCNLHAVCESPLIECLNQSLWNLVCILWHARCRSTVNSGNVVYNRC